MDDDVGFTFFLNLSFNQHEKDYPHDKITFHDFSSICMNNWEKLEEDAKKKIIELAKKENEENERKPTINSNDGDKENPIDLEDNDFEIKPKKPKISLNEFINVTKVVEIGERIRKDFGKQYSYCKRSRSAYIYFVKAARIDCKNRIQSSKDNFIEISRAISSKWNELKGNQRKVFEDCALLDKRFNGFKTEAVVKKKITANHTSLFLKAKQEARDHHATTSTTSSAGSSGSRLRNLTTVRRATTSTTRRKRKRTKKRKTTKKTVTIRRVKTERKPSIKMERIKSENKSSIKRIKVKRE